MKKPTFCAEYVYPFCDPIFRFAAPLAILRAEGGDGCNIPRFRSVGTFASSA
jgi:hypothetical protein